MIINENMMMHRKVNEATPIGTQLNANKREHFELAKVINAIQVVSVYYLSNTDISRP